MGHGGLVSSVATWDISRNSVVTSVLANLYTLREDIYHVIRKRTKKHYIIFNLTVLKCPIAIQYMRN